MADTHNNDNNIWSEGRTKKPEEPMSRTQKIFMTVVMSVMVAAIILVVLLNIPWGGDKAKIAKAYDSLSKDHVFKTATVDEMTALAKENGSFYLMVSSPSLSTANQFVYEVNAVAKEEGISLVYYIDSTSLTASEIRSVRALVDDSGVTFPSLAKFVPTENGSSATPSAHCCDRTDSHSLTNYQGNLRLLVREVYAFDENA